MLEEGIKAAVPEEKRHKEIKKARGFNAEKGWRRPNIKPRHTGRSGGK